MGTLKAIALAFAAFFGWREKVAKTPEQAEREAIRKQNESAHAEIDRNIDGAGRP